MKTQLIKTTGKFILVSDETPKEGDRCFSFYTNEIVQYGLPHTIQCSKIISEDPNFSQLSEEECKKIGFVDIEKLALEKYQDGNVLFNRTSQKWHRLIWKEGFKKAQELNEKQFSLDDIKLIFGLGAANNANGKPSFDEAIQSLQQLKVWDVEIEKTLGKVYVDDQDAYGYDIWQPKITNNQIQLKQIVR